MKTIYIKFIYLLSFALFISCSGKSIEKKSSKKDPVIIAYVAGFNGVIDESKISASKITHINYAFVNVKDGKAVLENESVDTVNFAKLNKLKKINPDLKILISLGGWAWSKNFSDAVLTPEAREIFTQSCVDIMTTYKLDGIDIDWEYPAISGDEGNIYRPEDKQNYTLMFASVRQKLDSLENAHNRTYMLTTAVGAFGTFVDNTEMDKVHQYLDYVNIMTYDSQSGEEAIHHTNLFQSQSYNRVNGADIIIERYVEEGVPMEKLVMGIAFYSRTFQMKDDAKKGLGEAPVKQIEGKGYTYIKDSLINKNGYVRLWDSVAQAPYIFNDEKNIFLSFDDEESVKAKCNYVLENKMGGVMFWEYSSDPKEYLLDAINEVL